MSRVLLFAAVCLGLGSAIAQPNHGAVPGGDRQHEREQRRIELRNALLAGRQTDVDVPKQVAPAPGARHLSPLERAEMRQQLRQQQAAQRPSP